MTTGDKQTFTIYVTRDLIPWGIRKVEGAYYTDERRLSVWGAGVDGSRTIYHNHTRGGASNEWHLDIEGASKAACELLSLKRVRAECEVTWLKAFEASVAAGELGGVDYYKFLAPLREMEARLRGDALKGDSK